MTSIKTGFYSTIYPEAFPSLTTLQKLIHCDRVIVADNLQFNKRDKVNQISFKNQKYFTIPIKHQNETYSNLRFADQTNWQRKLIRYLDTEFQQSTIYYFHQYELHELIKSAVRYIDLSLNLLNFVNRLLKLNCKIEMASSFSKKFDLNLILSESMGTYLVEAKYVDYLEKTGFNNFKEISMQTNYDLKKKPSIGLIMEFGHYLPNLILGF